MKKKGRISARKSGEKPRGNSKSNIIFQQKCWHFPTTNCKFLTKKHYIFFMAKCYSESIRFENLQFVKQI